MLPEKRMHRELEMRRNLCLCSAEPAEAQAQS